MRDFQMPSVGPFCDIDDVSDSIFGCIVSEEVRSVDSTRVKTRLIRQANTQFTKAENPADIAGLACPTATSVSTSPRFGSLEIVEGPGLGQSFPLEKRRYSIGRGALQDIRLRYGDLCVSRNRHAIILCNADTNSVSLVDGGKENPVLLNGKVLDGAWILNNADEISLGKTTLLYIAPFA